MTAIFETVMQRGRSLAVLLVLSSLLNAQQSINPKLDDLKREAIGHVEELGVFTQQMVDQIFSYSELGFQEHETSKYVTEILENNGFQVDRGVAGIPTAWVATFGSSKPVIG